MFAVIGPNTFHKFFLTNHRFQIGGRESSLRFGFAGLLIVNDEVKTSLTEEPQTTLL